MIPVVVANVQLRSIRIITISIKGYNSFIKTDICHIGQVIILSCELRQAEVAAVLSI